MSKLSVKRGAYRVQKYACRTILFATGVLKYAVYRLRAKFFSEKRADLRLWLHYRWANLRRDGAAFWQDLWDWRFFFVGYLKRKLYTFGRYFEDNKGAIVSLLMAKRGRYSRPFLNLSVFLLVGAGFVAAPIIKENHPIVGAGEDLDDFTPPSAVLTSISEEQIATSTERSDRPRDSVIEYEVQDKDTVSTIAEKFGVTANSIRWLNNFKEKNPLIKKGQKINIPPDVGSEDVVVHTVKKGETVYSIAERYKTDPQKIVNWPFNDFTDLEIFALEVGQTLIVPGGVIGEAPAVVPRVVPVPQIIAEGDGQFLWPAGGKISQYYVWYHKALDIANKSAPGIAAADTGTVTYANCERWGYGCHVILDHGNGLQTLYAHMSKIYVSTEPGENEVSRGQAVGQMGCTGRCTGTHLHFEIRKNGVLVNPLPYLQ